VFFVFISEADFVLFYVILFSLSSDEEGVKELPQKRRPANSDVSFRGRVRKVAKWKAESDEEDYGDSECEFFFKRYAFVSQV